MTKKPRRIVVLFSYLLMNITFMPLSLSAESLQGYLQQVAKANLQLQSSQAELQAATLKEREADLVFTPELFANAQWAEDEKESSFPGLSYDRIKNHNYSLGIKQNFSFGLNAKLFYAYDFLTYENVTGMTSDIKVYDARPAAELSLSLWKNAFGKNDRAKAELLHQQSEAAEFAAKAQKDATFIQAEAAYWRLAIARELVDIQEKALKQSEEILAYVSKRARMNLGESADRLQAAALVEAKRLEVKMAQNEEKAASRTFNVLRQSHLDAAITNLDEVPYDSLLSFQAPSQRPGDRNDVKAALAQLEAAKLGAQMERETYKPSLELFGSYALNGRSTSKGSEAVSDSFDSDRSTNAIGIRFSMPLFAGAAYDTQIAARLNEQAANLKARQKQLDQENDYQELLSLLTESQESLKLAKAIESAQNKKLLNERSRLKTGRTSTFQILQFEQEFSQSEFNRVKMASQILTLQTKLKMYSANLSSSQEGK